ncbi:MAG: type II toxin-antitoxin system HicA family toxin [Bacteroidales bacterium]|nr:type II toxin-antitoxin system HicA family toxin [Bacteroidales bacterium]
MTKKDKLIERFLSNPKDFKYNELETLIEHFGYAEIKKGKTSGSRRAFVSENTKHIIRLHQPHKKGVLKQYQIDYLINELRKEDIL